MMKKDGDDDDGDLVVDVDDNDDVGNLVDTVVAIPAPPLPLPTGAGDVQARKRLRSKAMNQFWFDWLSFKKWNKQSDFV